MFTPFALFQGDPGETPKSAGRFTGWIIASNGAPSASGKKPVQGLEKTTEINHKTKTISMMSRFKLNRWWNACVCKIERMIRLNWASGDSNLNCFQISHTYLLWCLVKLGRCLIKLKAAFGALPHPSMKEGESKEGCAHFDEKLLIGLDTHLVIRHSSSPFNSQIENNYLSFWKCIQYC